MTGTALGALAAAIALAAGGDAAATILKATYTGTVSFGTDVTGLFGAPGADLSGDAYVATFTIDTAKGAYFQDLPLYDELYGGTDFRLSVPVSATLQINGVTQSIGGSYLSVFQAAPYSVDTAAEAEDYIVSGQIVTDDLIQMNAYGASPSSVFDTLPLSKTENEGGAVFKTYNFGTNQTVEYETFYFDAPGTAEISDVPEPATWAMMLVGVGVVGAVMRGTRKRSMARGSDRGPVRMSAFQDASNVRFRSGLPCDEVVQA